MTGPAEPDPRTRSTLELRVNGIDRTVQVDNRASLLDTLRQGLGLTGAKKGCDHGQCGSCTVLLDDRRVNACLLLAVAADGAEVRTVEGLGADGQLSALQEAFVEWEGFQCGYCTSGQLCSARGMLAEAAAGWASAATADLTQVPELDEVEIRERMAGNLCRCGAYAGIVAAIRQAHDGARA